MIGEGSEGSEGSGSSVGSGGSSGSGGSNSSGGSSGSSDSSGSDETVIEGVGICSGGGEGGEISVGVTDDSVGLEMEKEVADGSDGAEICMDEVDPDMTGEIEVDSTEVGGEIRSLSPPLRKESVEAGLLELGSGTSSGLTSSEIVGTSDGGDMTLSTSTGSGSSSITDSDSSTSLGGSIVLSTSTSSDSSSSSSSDSSSDSSSTTVLALCPQRHSAVPKSVEASLRQTSQVSNSVLVSVVHTSAVLKAECTSEGDLAVLNSVGVPSAE